MDARTGTGRDGYDPLGIVDKWVERWRRLRVFEAGGLAAPAGQAVEARPRSYVVGMYPYPSGDLHMGHAEAYSITDVLARFARLRGRNTLCPIGWDSFGLPAENAALKRDLDPRDWTYANIAVQAESFARLGVSFDWRTRLHTSDPEYYRWNQWLFLRLFENDLAHRASAPVNWCPVDRTVLANEQVLGGRCERCGTRVQVQHRTQWFFRTTRYAQRLLDDMAQLEDGWPAHVLAMQRHWIGRSEGAEIAFAVEGRDEPLRVFSSRPDTLFGATFLAVAADAPLADELCADSRREALAAYRDELTGGSDAGRRATSGVELGCSAVHPMTGARLPVYAAEYVVAGYGTGAVMGVPGHDQRDLDFALAMGLPVVVVVDTGGADPATSGTAADGDGVLVSSPGFDGLARDAAIRAVTAELERRGAGAAAVRYRLRDWLVSRQRYWGTPIPIVHCPACGTVPVPDDQLPVRLPETGYELRPDDGAAPLASATAWVSVDCPACGGAARRDTDTMDTFVDSSWYFLRYPNPRYADGPFDPAGLARWLPVDEYVGGVEHATGHLIYARFVTKVLHDLGLLPFTEPFTRLTNQGQVVMGGRAMSKSLGNLVSLAEQLAAHGPDAVRVTMLFAGPPEEDLDWADVSPAGAVKWLARVWRLCADLGPAAPGAGDPAVRRRVHRLVAETTTLVEGTRLNVAVARLMELTSALRTAVDRGPGPADPAVREGADALVRMLSCVAPFTAEECWERLGHAPSVVQHGWPEADEALLTEESVTCVVQVGGKVRDRIPVPPGIGEAELRAAALRSDRVRAALDGASVAQVVVRPPGLVNVVPARSARR
ncbi:leucine--tRNA ligase [Pseudonocardia sichuanensis]